MLRLFFVAILLGLGIVLALQGPFPALLFYLWNAYFRPDDWTYGAVLVPLRLSLIIGFYLVVRTLLTFPDPKINKQTVLLGLFAIQCILSSFTSEFPETSWLFLEDFGKVLLISYLIPVLVTTKNRLRWTVFVIAVSLGFETAKQGWVALVLHPGAVNRNPHAFLGDNNGVAMGTMMLLPLVGVLARTSTKRWERFGHWFLGLGVFVRGISTYSRGGFLGAMVLGALTLLGSPRRFRALVAVLALGAVVWFAMPETFWNRMGTITPESEEALDSSAAGRLHFWRVATVMADEKPLTGVGLLAFSKAYTTRNTDDRFGGERAAHSMWFGVLGELGYPGLLLFMLNLAAAMWACWQVKRSRLVRDPELRWYATALFNALMVSAISASFLAAQYNEMHWHLIGLSAAVASIARSGGSDEPLETRR